MRVIISNFLLLFISAALYYYIPKYHLMENARLFYLISLLPAAFFVYLPIGNIIHSFDEFRLKEFFFIFQNNNSTLVQSYKVEKGLFRIW